MIGVPRTGGRSSGARFLRESGDGRGRRDVVCGRARFSAARAAGILTWAARLAGLLAIVSVVTPVLRERLHPAAWLGLPAQAGEAGAVITAVSGVGLIMLATGLRRRKRRAWGLAVLLCVLLVAAHLLGHRQLAVPALALAVLVGLWVSRRQFTALPDPVGRLAALGVLAQFLGAGFVLVSVLLFVRPSLLAGRPSVAARLAQAGLSLVGITGPVGFRAGWLDDLTAGIGLSFGIAAVALGGYFWLRSAEPRAGLSTEDVPAIRSLLARHGRDDSLGYFALRADKAVVFAASGKAAVAYRVLAGVALASGDPLGDVEAWPGAIAVFLARCRRHGWVPAVLGCSETGARVWTREGGLEALEFGDEAVVDALDFSVQGRSMRTVRQAVSRVRRAGYRTVVRRLDEVDVEQRAELQSLVERWRGGPTERGFSMALSRVADADVDPQAVVVIACRNGCVAGLLQFVPWGPDGLSLDVMIRDPAVSDNGLNELLVVDLLAACAELGVARVSLNFAVFRSALERGRRIGAGPVARLWARLLRIASRWWQIETLYRFNAGFDPAWVPRFLVFGAVRDLPRIAVAAFEAEGYGGRPPALLRLLHRRDPDEHRANP